MNNTETAQNNTTVNLSIRNDVIFKKVFSQKKIIQPFLEGVTKQKLDGIQIVDAEKTVYPSAMARSNRFDVCLLNSGNVYDTEMQTGKFEDLLERAMHHASVLEVENTPKGLLDMRDIEDVWVIFICTKDFFHIGERKYELVVQVKDHPELKVPQYRHIIILNAKGRKGDAGGEGVNGFLDYLDTLKNPGNNEFVNNVDSEVEEAKKDPSTREAAMTLEQMMYGKQQEGLKQGREEGREEGRKEGRKEGLEEGALAKEAEMICRLHSKGKSDEEIAELLDLDLARVQTCITQGGEKQ